MKMTKTFPVLLVVAVVLIYSSCKKETISNIPAIKFVSMAPGTAKKYVDTVKITISYTDGDGDVGSDSIDVKNLFVTDSRNNITSQFRVPQLTHDANTAITGNLEVVLSPQGFVDDSHTTETATFSVYLQDRAGNKSNTVQTSTLTINQ